MKFLLKYFALTFIPRKSIMEPKKNLKSNLFCFIVVYKEFLWMVFNSYFIYTVS